MSDGWLDAVADEALEFVEEGMDIMTAMGGSAIEYVTGGSEPVQGAERAMKNDNLIHAHEQTPDQNKLQDVQVDIDLEETMELANRLSADPGGPDLV